MLASVHTRSASGAVVVAYLAVLAWIGPLFWFLNSLVRSGPSLDTRRTGSGRRGSGEGWARSPWPIPSMSGVAGRGRCLVVDEVGGPSDRAGRGL